eukprot:1408877-Amphidinium_carterae.1
MLGMEQLPYGMNGSARKHPPDKHPQRCLLTKVGTWGSKSWAVCSWCFTKCAVIGFNGCLTGTKFRYALGPMLPLLG